MTTKPQTQADDHVRRAIRSLKELSDPIRQGWNITERNSSLEHELAVLRHVAGHIAQARRKLAKELMDDRVALLLREGIRSDLNPKQFHL